MIKFLDLKAVNAPHLNNINLASQRVLSSGWYIRGQEVKKFEQAFATYSQAKYAIGVGNGLDALTLVLKAWIALGKINPHDEVIIPANTFIATALAVSHANLNIVLADIDPNTFNICPDSIKKVITDKTKVILPVHLYGQMANMKAIKAIAAKHQLLILEDAAQAAGARTKQSHAGSEGDAAGFSFYPGKNLGALGDGGMVTTNNKSLADMVRLLANYGSEQKYVHSEQGINSRLDELQAAILYEKLPFLDHENRERQAIASHYSLNIDNPLITTPAINETGEHVWHLYVVRTSSSALLQQYLADKGIQSAIHYPQTINNQQAYQANKLEPQPIAEQFQQQLLSIPISPVLGIDEQNQVISVLNSFTGIDPHE